MTYERTENFCCDGAALGGKYEGYGASFATSEQACKAKVEAECSVLRKFREIAPVF